MGRTQEEIEVSRSRYIILQSMILCLVAWMLVGYVQAQNQDYLNGTFSAQITAISERLARLENMLNYVLTAVLGVLIVQMMNLRQTHKNKIIP